MKIGSLKISNKILKKTKLMLVITLSSLAISSCSNKESSNKISTEISDVGIDNALAKTAITINEIEKVKDLKIKIETKEEASMLVVGDDLISSTVYTAAKNNGVYNFDSLFENIKEELDSADIKVINQETMLVNDPDDYSGYPCFGSPTMVGDAIVKAGFNVVLHATNHSFDKGVSGVEQTLDYWSKYPEIKVLGIHENEEDYNEINVINVNGIKIALLNYTYGLNSLTLPSDKQYLVDTLYDEEKIKNDIKKADNMGDLTVVFVHYGTEYVYSPTDYQINISNIMAEAGADLIVGGHPHVVEPLEYITTTDGRSVPVYYSLGNFVSSQDEDPRMLGGMALIKIEKKDNKITLDCKLLPLVTQYESGVPFTTYKLEDYTNELGIKNYNGLDLDYLYNLWNSIVGEKDKVELINKLQRTDKLKEKNKVYIK